MKRSQLVYLAIFLGFSINGYSQTGNLVINAGTSVLVNSGTTMDVTGQLTIQAESGNNASLINKGTLNIGGSGQGVTVESYLPSTGAGFRLVSSPVSDQAIDAFVSGNSIPHKDIGGTDVYAMQAYSETNNEWTYFPFLGTPSTAMGIGTGYSLLGQDAKVSYSGSGINSGVIPVSITASGQAWNSIGNPYTSAIEATGEIGTTTDFLSLNSAQLDDPSAGLFFWDGSGWDSYNGSSGSQMFQIGQGFFVKSKTGGGSVGFNSAMQHHSPATAIKSTPNEHYKFRLMAKQGEKEKLTSVYFRYDMNLGLDVTFDVSLRKVNTDFEVYTKLIEGYPEIDFQYQALPVLDLEDLTIPVGLDCADGGEIIFSAAELNLPQGIFEFFLEDKQTDSFTDLSIEGASYTAEVPKGTEGSGRFFIHLKFNSTGINIDENKLLKAFCNINKEIQIVGPVGPGASASVFDNKGKLLGIYQLNSENINLIPVNQLSNGVYILRVKDGVKVFRKSIPIF